MATVTARAATSAGWGVVFIDRAWRLQVWPPEDFDWRPSSQRAAERIFRVQPAQWSDARVLPYDQCLLVRAGEPIG